MKFIRKIRIAYLRSYCLILGIALIPVNQAQSLDSMIAFSSDRDNPGGNHDIFVMKPNGSQVRNLSNNAEFQEWDPGWSPDGKKIAFGTSHDRSSDVYAIDADGKNPVRLTRAPEWDGQPSWSADGTKIAFMAKREQRFDGPIMLPNGQVVDLVIIKDDREIYVIDADGNNPVRLTRSPGWDGNPSWSPDGTKIAFASERARVFDIDRSDVEIYVMDADGNNPVRLTRSPGWDGNPSWSPDGRKIAFTSMRNGNPDVYVMDANGKKPFRLTRSLEWDDETTWSPDGRKIAFSTKRDGNWEIYIMDANGRNPTNLTQNPAADKMPAWSPNPLAVSPKERLLTLWAAIKAAQ